MLIMEDSNLYRGIFWIKDIDNIDNSDLYFQIPCNSDGIIDNEFSINNAMSSKNTNNYNHQKVWSSLSSKETNNKDFDYYPRGRVEISNGKAVIYCSPWLDSEKIKNWVISKFNLTVHNGIKKVRVIYDYSEHYNCYLDR